jgi:hypothetical protein
LSFLPAAAAQELPTKPAPQPAVTVLGEVAVHSVPIVADATMLDVFFAAKVGNKGAKDSLLVVRCGADGVLVVDVDVLDMLKTGRTTANIQMRDGDLVFVPRRDMVTAAKTPMDVVDAVVREAAAGHWPAAQRARLAAWRLSSEPDAARRHDFVVEIGKLAADAAVAVPALTKALAGDVAIARDAATALGMLGAAAAPALPELAKGAMSGDVQLRERCKAAMRAIDAAKKPPEPAVTAPPR